MGKFGQLWALCTQGRVGLLQGYRSPDGDVVGMAFDALQIPHPGEIQDRVEHAVLLGHPQAHVGAAGHQLSTAHIAARAQQLRQRIGGNIGRMGRWRACLLVYLL